MQWGSDEQWGSEYFGYNGQIYDISGRQKIDIMLVWSASPIALLLYKKKISGTEVIRTPDEITDQAYFTPVPSVSQLIRPT